MDDKPQRDVPPMEDYSGDDADGGQPSAFGDRTDLDVTPLSSAPGASSEAAADLAGEGFAPEGTPYRAGDVDVRTGQVKGGTPGSDPLAGPGQYGGDAGSFSEDGGRKREADNKT